MEHNYQQLTTFLITNLFQRKIQIYHICICSEHPLPDTSLLMLITNKRTEMKSIHKEEIDTLTFPKFWGWCKIMRVWSAMWRCPSVWPVWWPVTWRRRTLGRWPSPFWRRWTSKHRRRRRPAIVWRWWPPPIKRWRAAVEGRRAPLIKVWRTLTPASWTPASWRRKPSSRWRKRSVSVHHWWRPTPRWW